MIPVAKVKGLERKTQRRTPDAGDDPGFVPNLAELIPDEAYLGTLLTLRRGIGAEKGYAEWCEEAAEMILSTAAFRKRT